MEEIVKQMGFENEKEFHKMVSDIDLSNPIKMQKFLKWREEDGTKNGLLKVINENGNQ